MRLKRVIIWIVVTLILLIGLVLGYDHFILDLEGKPYCHKQIMFAFMNWMTDQDMDINSGTNNFPNVNGIGRDSLATISNGLAGQMEWAKDYRYVPGLRENDPGDLVLLYLDRPTRWDLHVLTPTIFKEKAWMVVPVDYTMGSRPRTGRGELSERVSLDEFRNRLRRTLDFVRTNERPNWQTIVAEHTKFLDSIEQVKR
ncbi:MAG: hypothetical protein WCH99_08120 [Verrucomicrobiota bacterium]